MSEQYFRESGADRDQQGCRGCGRVGLSVSGAPRGFIDVKTTSADAGANINRDDII